MPLWLSSTSMALLIFHLNTGFSAEPFFERVCTQLSPYLYFCKWLLLLKSNILHMYLCFETTSPICQIHLGLYLCPAIEFFSFMKSGHLGSIFCPLKRAGARKDSFKVLLNTSSYFESGLLITTLLVVTQCLK